MKLSLNWLNKFVDIAHLDAEDVMEKLTLHTAEIEDLERKGDNLSGIVTARIQQTQAIGPGYFVVSLDAGYPTQVVCTDKTLSKGDWVVLATPGSTVEGVKVEAKEIRGHQSEGMLLCERELGISGYDETCLVIDEGPGAKDAPVGSPLTIALPFLKDTLLWLDNKSVTHRPDLWGIYGFARELAAIYRQPLKPLPITSIEAINESSLPGPDIRVVDKEGCKRYASVLIDSFPDVKAPLEMRTLLFYSEVNPINFATDLTNFVMLETGQPMHAFDNKNVRNSIIVDKTSAAIDFEFLDGKERPLPAGSLMIYDGERSPVALAGVMGGQHSKISDSTRTVLLECANFDATVVRMTSTQIKLRTDASARFEKSLVPRLALVAIQRYVHLLRETTPGAVVSRLVDENSVVESERRVQLSHSFVGGFMGKSLPVAEVSDILNRIGLKNDYKDGLFDVLLPWYRSEKDLANAADLVEEVARLHGYNNIQPESPLLGIEPLHRNALVDTEYALKQILSFQYGFNEVRTYAWDDSRWLAKISWEPADTVGLQNPSSVFTKNLKTSLVPALLQLAEKNLAFNDIVRIYECESIFSAKTNSERKSLAGILSEKKGEEQTLFFAAKDYFQNICKSLRNKQIEFREYAIEAAGGWYQPELSVAIFCDEQYFGYITILNHRLRNTIMKNTPSVIFEFDIEAFRDLPAAPEVYTEPLSFPTVNLDFNIIAGRKNKYTDVAKVVREFKHEITLEYKFKETFQDEKRLPGKKSFVFTFVLGSPKGTLDGEQISAFQEQFIEHIEAHGFNLRA